MDSAIVVLDMEIVSGFARGEKLQEPSVGMACKLLLAKNTYNLND